MDTLIGISVAVIILAIIIWWSYKNSKKRTKALKEVASSLNFTYSETAEHSMVALLSDYSLLSKGYNQMVNNVMGGRFNDIDVIIADYQYNESGSRRIPNQTVIVLNSPQMQLPSFTIQPENWAHKVGSAVGHQDIDFDSHKAFSDDYLLRGKDEGAVRNLFTDELIAYFEQHKKLCAEGEDTNLMFFRFNKQVPPENIRSFLEEGLGVYNLVKTQG